MPILLCALYLRTHGLLDRWSTPWARGELLLISALIVATSIGELLTASAAKIPMRPHLAGGAIIFLLLAAGWYMVVLCAVSSSQNYDDELVRHRSPVMLGLSLILGAACVMLAKESERR